MVCGVGLSCGLDLITQLNIQLEFYGDSVNGTHVVRCKEVRVP